MIFLVDFACLDWYIATNGQPGFTDVWFQFGQMDPSLTIVRPRLITSKRF